VVRVEQGLAGLAWFGADGYTVARAVVQRGVAAVYLLAFVAVLRQFRPLLGEHGLLPVPRFTARVPWRAAPSLFAWRYSDRLLVLAGWAGVLVAALLVAGLPQQGPPWLPLLAFGVLWALYLSVVNVGQTFYGLAGSPCCWRPGSSPRSSGRTGWRRRGSCSPCSGGWCSGSSSVPGSSSGAATRRGATSRRCTTTTRRSRCRAR